MKTSKEININKYFTQKELEAIYDIISSMNAKDIQRSIYYRIEKKLKKYCHEEMNNENNQRKIMP